MTVTVLSQYRQYAGYGATAQSDDADPVTSGEKRSPHVTTVVTGTTGTPLIVTGLQAQGLDFSDEPLQPCLLVDLVCAECGEVVACHGALVFTRQAGKVAELPRWPG